ncbi:MAG: TerD family protein [Lachnospiraceae bacterium]|nr:TerD family protein [Lachnospiraceae bacterium]
MAISLEKGQKVSLTKDAPSLNEICVGLGWQANKSRGLFGGGGTYDLDASAIICRNGKLRTSKDVCYYGNKNKFGDPVYHHGDELVGGDGSGDEEQISIRLSALDSDVDRIIIIVNIYDARHKKQSFADVKKAFMRLVDENNGTEMYRYNLSDGSVGDVSSLIFGELYKKDGEWKFNAIGQGVKEDKIKDIAALYM